MNIQKIELITKKIKTCFDNKKIQEAFNYYENSTIVIEGSNGSIGQSFLFALNVIGVKNIELILTNNKSQISNLWKKSGFLIKNFNNRDDIEKYINNNNKNTHVFYAAGYGQPNIFLGDPHSMIQTNIKQVLDYTALPLKSFSYISTAEIYSGIPGEVNENSLIIANPNNIRSTYVNCKLLGESIVNNVLKNVDRKCSYRVALAFPFEYSDRDTRVLADLVKKAYKNQLILNGGGDFIRQYQYAPMCATKIMLGTALGNSSVYNVSGNYIYTLAEITKLIANLFNIEYVIEKNIKDSSAPKSVLVNSNLLDSQISYINNFINFNDCLRLYAK